MLKKFTKKLRRPTPSPSTQSPGANNQRSDRWNELFNATQMILEITKESVKAVPVPALEAAVGGVAAVLNVYRTMRANEDALKLLGEALERLDKQITRPLTESVAKDPNFLDEDLKERLNGLAEELTNLTKRAEALLSRRAYKKVFGYKEDSGLILELNKELDRIILTFTAQGSIGGEVEARKARKAAQMILINGMRRAQARHDSSSRVGTNSCFEGTRTSILKAISTWIEDSSSSSIFWLSGMAGIGKSTIAQTVAELEESKHRLGASFFFSRDDAERRDPGLVCPTIAYQLAIFDDALKRSVAYALEKDPDVTFGMVKTQFEEFIAKPLKGINKSGETIVFVLDALDECDPNSGAVEILRRWAVELPRISQETKVILKVLVTSRPELHIQNQFQSPFLRPISRQLILHNVEESVVQADIELFLRHRFNELADLHAMAKPWPLEADLLELVERSSNLFIFAATAINFVASAKSGRLMQARLEMLLEPINHDPASIYQKLDACYLHILQVAERELEPTMQDGKNKFRLVLGAIVLLQSPLSAGALESLLSLAPGDVITAIQDLGSVLILPDINDFSTPVRIFHPSFHDFITSPSRHSEDFFLPTADSHARLAQVCFSVIRKSLKRHPGFVGDPWLSNSEVLGGVDNLQAKIPVHLGYACRFLASHVSLASTSDDILAESMKIFCENDLLTWLEAMSLLGDIDNAVSSVQAMRAWCSKTPSIIEQSRELLHDAYRVLLQYQLPLRHSAGHLYTTVLSFSPPCSLTKQYASQLHVEYVLQGQPNTWDATLITMEAKSFVAAVASCPDGERIVTADITGSVTVWSSATGAPISSVECNHHWGGWDWRPVPLAVAHDGTRIASAPPSSNSICIWDASTGANVAILGGWVTEVDEPSRGQAPPERCSFVDFLPGSNDLVSVSDVCTLYRWDSQTLKVKYTCDLHDEQPEAVVMAQGGLTLAVLHDKMLRIWSIGAEGVTLMKKLRGGRSYRRAWGAINTSSPVAFLPGTTKIAWVAAVAGHSEIQEMTIWDYVSGVRLQHMKVDSGQFALSCDGTRVAFAARSEIRVYDTDSFTLLGRLLGPATRVRDMLFLKKGLMLVTVGKDFTVRTWDCAELSTLPEPRWSQHHGMCDSILASQGGEKIAFCYRDTLFLLDSSLHTFEKLTVKSTTAPEVVMSPDGRFIAISQVSGRNTLRCTWRLYETKTLESICTYQLSLQSAGVSVFSDDGQLLAISCTTDGGSPIVAVFSLITKTVIFTKRINSCPRHLAFSPDNKHLLCVEPRILKYTMLDVFTGETELSVRLPIVGWPIRSVRFWPDGLSILVVVRASEASVLEASTLRIMDRFKIGPMVQVIPTNSGPELNFLLCKNGGYLYQCTRDKEIPLVWLPPSWRAAFAMDYGGARKAVWRGSRVIFLLENGELGFLDLQAVLKSRADEGAGGDKCAA